MQEPVARSVIGTMTYLAPAGPLSGEASCQALEDAISECMAASQINLILDLERVSLVSSRALEIILDSNAKLTHSGGALRFVNPSPLVKDILAATGVGDQTTMNAAGFGELHAVGEEFSSAPEP